MSSELSPEFAALDWECATKQEQLAMVAHGSRNDINWLGRSYNWDYYPEEVLGAVAARKDCSLGTALTIFVLGEPGYYDGQNMAEVPQYHQSMLAFLTDVHDRINAGFYHHDISDGPEYPDLIQHYVANAGEPGRGMWALDPNIVNKALNVPSQSHKSSAAHARNYRKWLRNLLSSLGKN